MIMDVYVGETKVLYDSVPIVAWHDRRYAMAPYIAVTKNQAVFFHNDDSTNKGVVVDLAQYGTPITRHIHKTVDCTATHKLISKNYRRSISNV